MEQQLHNQYVQMNYWPVESANLSELFSPLNDLIHNLAINGKETAKTFIIFGWWYTTIQIFGQRQIR